MRHRKPAVAENKSPDLNDLRNDLDFFGDLLLRLSDDELANMLTAEELSEEATSASAAMLAAIRVFRATGGS